jgi:hypothetical protein
MSLVSACGTASDTPTGPSSTVVTPPAPVTGIVQGIVKREAYFGLVFSPEGRFPARKYLSARSHGSTGSFASVAVFSDNRLAFAWQITRRFI